jgi:hypothetical protein
MAGMDAVVAPARCEQDRRVGPAWDREVIGRDLAEELPIGQVVGIAVFGNLARRTCSFGWRRMSWLPDSRDK